MRPFFICGICLLSFPSHTCAQAVVKDAFSGQLVMIKEDNVKFQVGTRIVRQAFVGETFIVISESNGWLYSKKHSGWTKQANVISADKAIEYFTKLIDQSRDSTSLSKRARAWAGLAEYEKGIADLRESERLAPNQHHVYCTRGLMHIQAGNLKEALRDIDRSLLISKCDFSFRNRGIVNQSEILGNKY